MVVAAAKAADVISNCSFFSGETEQLNDVNFVLVSLLCWCRFCAGVAFCDAGVALVVLVSHFLFVAGRARKEPFLSFLNFSSSPIW